MGIGKLKPVAAGLFTVLFMAVMYQYLHKHHIKISKQFRGFNVDGYMNYAQIKEKPDRITPYTP
jgi:hypothetical protein